MTPIRLPCLALLLAALSACSGTNGGGTGTRGSLIEAPPGAPEGTCWSKHTSPAVVETVTRQVLDTPAQVAADGTVLRPAVFRTETRQQIVEPRRQSWVELPCPNRITPEFIASLQRALAARGVYHGPVTSRMDRATRAAVRRFQKQDGFDSSILSIATARKLGLIAVARPGQGSSG
ncbi:peptidoglycan-binding domain-containing protein [Roseobacteraceae bacterium NS-SX3]